jgi:hypothetical protein
LIAWHKLSDWDTREAWEKRMQRSDSSWNTHQSEVYSSWHWDIHRSFCGFPIYRMSHFVTRSEMETRLIGSAWRQRVSLVDHAQSWSGIDLSPERSFRWQENETIN